MASGAPPRRIEDTMTTEQKIICISLKLNLTTVSWFSHGESQAEAGRGVVGVAKRPASAH
jgi:hypothetical protein